MKRMINIEHKNGERYAVLPATYHRQYEPLGFKATTFEDNGEKYVAPVADDVAEAEPERKKAGK